MLHLDIQDKFQLFRLELHKRRITEMMMSPTVTIESQLKVNIFLNFKCSIPTCQHNIFGKYSFQLFFSCKTIPQRMNELIYKSELRHHTNLQQNPPQNVTQPLTEMCVCLSVRVCRWWQEEIRQPSHRLWRLSDGRSISVISCWTSFLSSGTDRFELAAEMTPSLPPVKDDCAYVSVYISVCGDIQ